MSDGTTTKTTRRYRSFDNKVRRKILKEHRKAKPGKKAAVLKKYGINASHIDYWKRRFGMSRPRAKKTA